MSENVRVQKGHSLNKVSSSLSRFSKLGSKKQPENVVSITETKLEKKNFGKFTHSHSAIKKAVVKQEPIKPVEVTPKKTNFSSLLRGVHSKKV